MERQEIEKAIASHPNWYHQIELAPGLVTPGTHNSAAALADLDAIGLPKSCKGMRVLDIGCRDGFFSFEMERRGAEVVGIDYADSSVTGFAVAARILGSRVPYVIQNVYDLSPDKIGKFDLILFLGVLYHLRNPMLALDHIREVQAPGGTVIVETQLAIDPTAASSKTPLWEFFPRDTLGDSYTNKFAPNMPALVAVMEECLYTVQASHSTGARGYVRATAVENQTMAYFRTLDSSAGLWRKPADQ